MKNALFLFVLCFSISGVAQETICKSSNPSAANVFKSGEWSLVTIGESNVAKLLYDSLTNIPATRTDKVPADVEMYLKDGASIKCFKQVLPSCVSYQCNIPFENLSNGLIQ